MILLVSSASRSWHPAKLIYRQASRDSKVQPVNPGPKAPKEGLDRYLGGSLWINLSDEASVLLFTDLLAEEG